MLEGAREGSDSMNQTRSLAAHNAQVSDTNGPQLVSHHSSNSQGSILSSWKEIATYLGKGVRTVQRWENELGLPVHRPVPGSRRIVITTKEELAAWLAKQQTRAQAKRVPISRVEIERMKRLIDHTLARAEMLRANAEKLIGLMQKSLSARNLSVNRSHEMIKASQTLREKLHSTRELTSKVRGKTK